MEAAAPAEKLKTWREVVGPVFCGTWPPRRRTPNAEGQLQVGSDAKGHRRRVSGGGRRCDSPNHARACGQGNTVFSLRDADPALYKLAPRKLLDLLDAIVGASEPGRVYGLKIVLDRLLEADPAVTSLPKYQGLVLAAGRDV